MMVYYIAWSLLSTISFPAFATQIPALYSETKQRVVDQLKGQYGFKRFLREHREYKRHPRDLEEEYLRETERLNRPIT